MIFDNKSEVEAYSWILYENNVAKKIVDKTLIKESSSGVPLDITNFFSQNMLTPNKRKNITLVLNGVKLEVYFERKKDGRHRVNLKGIKDNLPLSTNDIGNSSLWFAKDSNIQDVFHLFLDSTNESFSLNSTRTEKISEVKTRIGQGIFKDKLLKKWDNKCAITSVIEHKPSILIASHTKPWNESNDIERLDGDNGLLLSPHIDKLFDSHRITFSKNSELVIAKVISDDLLTAWNISKATRLNLTDNQQYYMDYHRREFELTNGVNLSPPT